MCSVRWRKPLSRVKSFSRNVKSLWCCFILFNIVALSKLFQNMMTFYQYWIAESEFSLIFKYIRIIFNTYIYSYHIYIIFDTNTFGYLVVPKLYSGRLWQIYEYLDICISCSIQIFLFQICIVFVYCYIAKFSHLYWNIFWYRFVTCSLWER